MAGDSCLEQLRRPVCGRSSVRALEAMRSARGGCARPEPPRARARAGWGAPRSRPDGRSRAGPGRLAHAGCHHLDARALTTPSGRASEPHRACRAAHPHLLVTAVLGTDVGACDRRSCDHLVSRQDFWPGPLRMRIGPDSVEGPMRRRIGHRQRATGALSPPEMARSCAAEALVTSIEISARARSSVRPSVLRGAPDRPPGTCQRSRHAQPANAAPYAAPGIQRGILHRHDGEHRRPGGGVQNTERPPRRPPPRIDTGFGVMRCCRAAGWSGKPGRDARQVVSTDRPAPAPPEASGSRCRWP